MRVGELPVAPWLGRALFVVGTLFVAHAASAFVGTEPERLRALLLERAEIDATDEGVAALEAAVARRGSPAQWTALGLARASRGEWTRAEEAFRHAATENPLARLGVAVSLAETGRLDAAYRFLGGGAVATDARVLYARALLGLRAPSGPPFADLRPDLEPLLRSSGPLRRDAFDLWLALNPSDAELERRHHALVADGEPRAALERAEIDLRLGRLDRLREETRRGAGSGAEVGDVAIANGLLRLSAWAAFLEEEDARGQALYERLVDGLDEATAAVLFRDIAAIASPEERRSFDTLDLAAKRSFFRAFWEIRHPVPAAPTNPRLGEHYRRLADALRDDGLQSNGRGYFTDRETFASLSPRLASLGSIDVFAETAAAGYWIDPRGLVLLHRGAAGVRIRPNRGGEDDPAESWFVDRVQTTPVVLHFVRRSSVGEWTLVLNLGVAATRPAAADEPEAVLRSRTRALGRLYESRARLDPLYEQIVRVRSEEELARALEAESERMGQFVVAALGTDETSYYTRETTIPLAVSMSNLYVDGAPAVEVDLSADLRDIDADRLGPDSVLEARVGIYDRRTGQKLGEPSKTFSLWPPPEGKSRIFAGSLTLTGLDPDEYRMVVRVYQPDTGSVGIVRGLHATQYVPYDHLGVSDLLLFTSPRRATRGRRRAAATSSASDEDWLPAPTRTIPYKAPVAIDYEIYNLRPDEAGMVRYEVEERILTLYKEPGLGRKLLGYAGLAGQIFAPLPTFGAQVGGFTISQALAKEYAGLVADKRLGERPASPTIEETVRLDASRLKKGIYTVYVTVRDRVSGERTSRFLTLRIR